MSKFKNQYRIESSRASWWNYAGGGTYFITICTKNKEHFFGKIKNNKMELSHCGILANVFWYKIKTHIKNVELGAFVVMPNHIHGILKLKPTDIVETGHALSLQYRKNDPFEKSPLSNEKNKVPSNKTPITDNKTGHALSLRFLLIHCYLLRPDFFYAIGQNQYQ